MSVSPKSGACVPCSITCSGNAAKTSKITKILRNTISRGLPKSEWRYLWQAIVESDTPVAIGIKCSKPLSEKAEKAIAEEISRVCSIKIHEFIDSKGLNTETSDENYKPSCLAARKPGCATESGCQANVEISFTSDFTVTASIPKEDCVDDPDAPLDEVEVTLTGEPVLLSKGC